MQRLTLEDVLFTEEVIGDVVASLRATVRAGVPPEDVVNLSTFASDVSRVMEREDYAAMLSVAMWMLAKTDGPVDYGS